MKSEEDVDVLEPAGKTNGLMNDTKSQHILTVWSSVVDKPV